MATLTAELVTIVDRLVEKIQENRDIYATITIGYEIVTVTIYPYEDEENNGQD